MRLAMLSFLAMLGCYQPSFSAEMHRLPGDDGIDVITVSGVINEGDEEAFRKIAATADRAIVVLSSEGGSVTAGLEIGRAIRLRNFGTAVAPDNLCASACALTWLAGTPRFFSSRSLVPRRVPTKQWKSERKRCRQCAHRSLPQPNGLAEPGHHLCDPAPPEGIEWFSGEKAASLGISIQSLDNDTAKTFRETNSNEPYDPLRTVSTFTLLFRLPTARQPPLWWFQKKEAKALSNEQSIQAFFGNMSEPLAVQSLARKSKDMVRGLPLCNDSRESVRREG